LKNHALHSVEVRNALQLQRDTLTWWHWWATPRVEKIFFSKKNFYSKQIL